MDILYYEVGSKRNVKAINLDAIKRIECRSTNEEIENGRYIFEGVGLYLDDILVHHFIFEDFRDIYDSLQEDEEKVEKAYHLYCRELVSDEIEEKLMMTSGINGFKEFMQNTTLNADRLFKNYKHFGIEDYIRVLEKDKRFDDCDRITYKLLLIKLFGRYVNELKHPNQKIMINKENFEK